MNEFALFINPANVGLSGRYPTYANIVYLRGIGNFPSATDPVPE